MRNSDYVDAHFCLQAAQCTVCAHWNHCCSCDVQRNITTGVSDFGKNLATFYLDVHQERFQCSALTLMCQLMLYSSEE